SYMESVWWILKQIWDKELLYQGFKVVPYCPRDQTPLSSHELALGYQDDVEDPSVYVKFELEDEPNTYFLAWTTTPWTLPGNIALAVGPKIDYVKVKAGDEMYILAKDRLESVMKDAPHTVLETMKGSGLVGKAYKPLYPFAAEIASDKEKEKFENAYKVHAADFVTTEDG